MLICFLTAKASSIRNLIHQDRQWLENSIATSWGNWGKISGANVQTNGTTFPEHCIITMPQLTCPSSSSSFWLLWQQSSPTLPAHPSSPPAHFYCSQRWNRRSGGDTLTALKRPRLNHTGCDEDANAKRLLVVLPNMEILLGSLYQCTRRLLWRRRRRIEILVSG